MVIAQAPAVKVIIGADEHSGWLPAAAARPLPTPPQPAWLDIRLVREGPDTLLIWEPHDPSHSSYTSANGERRFPTLAAARRAATDLFGLGPHDWLISESVEAGVVAALRDIVLHAHGVEGPAAEGWGRLCDPPVLTRFIVPDGPDAQLWLLFEGDDYLVFYDAETGRCGLGIGDAKGLPTYIGDYGTLWATLMSM
jgi:hypothetical protein